MSPTVATIRSLFGNTAPACALDAWEEGKHPRGEGGRFGKGTGSGAVSKLKRVQKAERGVAGKVGEKAAAVHEKETAKAAKKATVEAKKASAAKAPKKKTAPAEPKSEAGAKPKAVKNAPKKEAKAAPAEVKSKAYQDSIDPIVARAAKLPQSIADLKDYSAPMRMLMQATRNATVHKNLTPGEHAEKLASMYQASLEVGPVKSSEPNAPERKALIAEVKKQAKKLGFVSKYKAGGTAPFNSSDFYIGEGHGASIPANGADVRVVTPPIHDANGKVVCQGDWEPIAKPKPKAAPKKAAAPKPSAKAASAKTPGAAASTSGHDIGHRVTFTEPAIVGDPVAGTGKVIQSKRSGIIQSIDNNGHFRVLDQNGSIRTLSPSELTGNAGPVPGEKERIQRHDALMAVSKPAKKTPAKKVATPKPKKTEAEAEPKTKAAPKKTAKPKPEMSPAKAPAKPRKPKLPAERDSPTPSKFWEIGY